MCEPKTCTIGVKQIRAAYAMAGHSTKAVLAELWPWVKAEEERPFHRGQAVCAADGATVTVVGYSHEADALDYFKTLTNAPVYDVGARLLCVTRDGTANWGKVHYYRQVEV